MVDGRTRLTLVVLQRLGQASDPLSNSQLKYLNAEVDMAAGACALYALSRSKRE